MASRRRGRFPPAAKILSEFVLKSGRHFAVVDRRIGASSAIKGKILSLDVECEDCAADLDARTFAGIVYDAWLEYGHKEAAPLKIDGVELRGFAKRRTSAWQFPLVTSINGPRNADGSSCAWEVARGFCRYGGRAVQGPDRCRVADARSEAMSAPTYFTETMNDIAGDRCTFH